MLIAAAVCPHPPLLVPEMAGAAASELDDVRAACDEAVRRLRLAMINPVSPRPVDENAPDLVVVVGGHEQTHRFGEGVYASFRPYGLEMTLSLGWGEAEELPLSLSLGHWLLLRALAQRQVLVTRLWHQAVAFDASLAECMTLGQELAEAGERVALLVMGDGSACRSVKAPGYLDARAGPYDATVARALGQADAAALAGLDPDLSGELQAAGRAAWQVLAGATGDNGESAFSGALLADAAPYGVGYFVASWLRNVS